jgi:hypothetical protein
MGQFLGELRDFSKLFKVRLLSIKDFGNNYLNAQFGWVPFLNDIRKFYETVMRIDKRIRYIRKNNNKWISRHGTIKQDVDNVVYEEVCNILPQLPTYFYYNVSTLPKATVRKTVSEHRWFEARWKFYIRDLSTDKAEDVISSRLRRHLWGLSITPALLWELTPWSWLADWFGNIGDVLENTSNSCYDNLVAKYAYCMAQRKTTYYYKNTWPYRVSSGPASVTAEALLSCESKERAGASPFGFELDWPEFNGYQLAILAALGISRGI